jgi:hypothetical protein
MRPNQRRPAPSLLAIAVALIAIAITALALAASGARAPAAGARDRADGDPPVAHVVVAERDSSDHPGGVAPTPVS